MKTLDYYISSLVSPFDENTGDDQTELSNNRYIEYQQDLITETIGKKENIFNIRLFLNDLLVILDLNEKQNFLRKILSKLISNYSLNFLNKYNNLSYLNKKDENEIIKLLKFIELDKYQEFFAIVLPAVDIIYQQESEKILKFIEDNYFVINKQIELNIEKCPKILHVFFKYTSKKDFIKFFTKLLSKDVLSVIVLQNSKKGD